MTPQQCHRPSRSWRGSGCSQESNEVAVVVTLTTAKAELVSWSMKTRDLKAGEGGQGRHWGSADFQEWLTVVVALPSCHPQDTGNRSGTDTGLRWKLAGEECVRMPE